MNDLEKCFEFIVEAEKLKAVSRRTKPIGLDRYENSAEHSWQIALLAVVLAPFAAEPVDIGRVVRMLLIHDLGEIDADDVFFFDADARALAAEKERAGVERILGLLPAETGADLLAMWHEFEAGETADSKFARAVDRVMPILQNVNNGRQSWIENGVTEEQILTRTSYIADGSSIVWESIAAKIRTAFET